MSRMSGALMICDVCELVEVYNSKCCNDKGGRTGGVVLVIELTLEARPEGIMQHTHRVNDCCIHGSLLVHSTVRVGITLASPPVSDNRTLIIVRESEECGSH